MGWTLVGWATAFPRWWELVATAGVPFLTLLMVVLLQHTQNHDARATQLKLDELIRASGNASDRMMTVEKASPEDLDWADVVFVCDVNTGAECSLRGGSR